MSTPLPCAGRHVKVPPFSFRIRPDLSTVWVGCRGPQQPCPGAVLRRCQAEGLRRRMGCDLEDQPAQVSPTASLRHPDCVRILCSTREKFPQAFAQLDGQPCTGSSCMERKNWDADLRRRSRDTLSFLTCAPGNRGRSGGFGETRSSAALRFLRSGVVLQNTLGIQ